MHFGAYNLHYLKHKQQYREMRLGIVLFAASRAKPIPTFF